MFESEYKLTARSKLYI